MLIRKQHRKVILAFLPVLLIIGMIFFASSQTYSDQDLRPELRSIDLSFLEPIAKKVTFHYAGSEVSVKRLDFEGYIEFFVRKSAHVVIFMLLAFFFCTFLSCFKMITWKKVILTMLFIFLYASFDESRHALNPGRTGLFADVLLDTFGGLLGTLVALIFQYRKERYSN